MAASTAVPPPATGPLVLPGAIGRVAPVYLIPLLAAAEQAGIASDALFHGLGLAAEDLALPGCSVSPTEGHTVVRRALRLMTAPDLGLTLGMHTRITERGALALGLLAAATLGEAIALALQFPGSAGYLMAVHAEQDSHGHREMAEPQCGNDDIAPFLVDLQFAGSVRMRRQMTNSRYAPARLELTRPRPDNAQAYEKHFACPVQFSCQRNRLSTDLAWLAHPLPLANRMAYRLSQQLLERELQRFSGPSALGLTVERALRRALPQPITLAPLARSLNLSERSLRRKLAQEGLSFRSLLDEARKTRALELMAGARRTIGNIAAQTGFSDVRAFSRAFKRWTGQSPSALHTVVAPPGAGADDDKPLA